MKVIELTEAEAKNLCTKEEDHFYDRKAFGIEGRKVQKIACAFANADGGTFIIGIADDKHEPIPENRWNGAEKIEDFNQLLQSVSSITPGLDWNFSFATCKNKPGYILMVNIDKSSFVHMTSDDKVYQRTSAQSLPLSAEKVMELSFAKGATSFEDEVINGAYPEDITESLEIKSFLSDLSPKSDPLEFVVNQNLIERKNFNPRCSGILLFNDTPSAIMPRKCAVKISRYESTEDLERDQLKEQYTIEGPLYSLIHNTINKITQIMSSISIWTSEGIQKVEYPPEAIWEIVVNAIIHRDYSISDDVHILIYNDRIEVLSPGKLPGYVTVGNILDARYSRNSKIVRMLNKYKNPPNKDMGEGLNTAFEKMKEWRLKKPEIFEQGNYVKVIIPHSKLARPEEIILEYLKEKKSINNEDAREITGIKSSGSIQKTFNKLKNEGLIERIPELKGRASAWRLIKK